MVRFGGPDPAVCARTRLAGATLLGRSVSDLLTQLEGALWFADKLQAGDSIENFVGPLGVPTHIEKLGTVVCVAGGISAAPITPIATALKAAGNNVISIMGARTKNLLFWEDRMRQASSELIVATDDGSYGRKGLVTEPLKEILSSQKVAQVIAIGPIPMMKFCALTTKPFGVKTIVSLNP